MSEKYVAPVHNKDGFNCPHCGAYAHQVWFNVVRGMVAPFGGRCVDIDRMSSSLCSRCDGSALWLDEHMLYPTASVAPLPTEDMPEDVKDDFSEARDIVNRSPRGAAALLRLALQKLMPHLEEKGDNLNDDIANLVTKGLPIKIKQALDAVRVIGNNAVHPGMMDLKDDEETALTLFGLLNIIVTGRITEPKKVAEIHDKLPESAKAQIKRRDAEAE